MPKGPLSESPKFETLYIPDDYPHTTDSAVWYLPVVLRGRIVGYLWAATTDDAIALTRCPEAGNTGIYAAIRWTERTRWAKRKGIRPLVLLRRFVGQAEDSRGGYIPRVKPKLAPSLDALREVAARTDNAWPPQA